MHADAPLCVKSDIAPANYSVTHVHRDIVSGGTTRGGGLAIFSRDELKVRSHSLANGLKVTSCELQLAKLSSRSTSFAILNIYRPPSNSVPTFLDELADIVSSICASLNYSLLQCGDLNCAGAESSSIDDNLESVLDSLSLNRLVRSPTREDHLLDVLATDARDAVSGVHVDDAGCISDHRLVLAKVKFSRPACRAIESTYRNIRKINLSAFESVLFQSTRFSSPAGTADEFADQVAEVVACELNKVAPVKKCKRRPSNPITKWLSTEAIVAKREHRRLKKRWKTSEKEHDRILTGVAVVQQTSSSLTTAATHFRTGCRIAEAPVSNGRLPKSYYRSRKKSV